MGNQRRSIPLPLTKEQKPIYYVSRALADVETRYSKMELTALALRSAAEKLRLISKLISDHPANTTNQVNKNGGLCELTEPHAHQALELAPTTVPNWGTFGASHPVGFSASNNEAEYEAILSGLDLALALSVSKLGSIATHNSCNSPNGQSKKSSELTIGALTPWTGIAASLPIKEAFYCLYMCNPTLSQKFPPAIPLRQTKRTVMDRSFTGPYLRCLGHSEAQYVLAELHEGICGNHSGGRSLAHRAHSQGYYWPTMKKDAAAYVKRCDKCQRYAPIPHMPSATLKSVSGPWPFAVGHGYSGTLPAAPAQKKFLLVATDYFSKWVEAEAYASIKDKDVTKFVWKNIVCRFGIPQTIIADNGPQFDSIAFRNFCSELNIRKFILHTAISSKSYPASYGLSNHTRTTNRKHSFRLAYGMDAVIPTEIGLPTIQTDAAKQNDANTELERNLDWADEVRESAAIRMADYQQRASAHYNRKVKPRSFKNGTLVLRKVLKTLLK
ncbi:hypothetical protein CK203_059538 [Vitis vinifera]|uniref:Integrase catalytic domain-containing protein n=1 Tax=Vitis vinifera TaxID=29760 RepID=A0A438FRN3_VITVI|nr:hypothetical protein CK203_059538 [Vitis vinifera]